MVQKKEIDDDFEYFARFRSILQCYYSLFKLNFSMLDSNTAHIDNLNTMLLMKLFEGTLPLYILTLMGPCVVCG